jgi:hypothetical protein
MMMMGHDSLTETADLTTSIDFWGFHSKTLRYSRLLSCKDNRIDTIEQDAPRFIEVRPLYRRWDIIHELSVLCTTKTPSRPPSYFILSHTSHFSPPSKSFLNPYPSQLIIQTSSASSIHRDLGRCNRWHILRKSLGLHRPSRNLCRSSSILLSARMYVPECICGLG